jgi:hypothetical protein
MKGRTEVPTAPKDGRCHLTELALKVPTHQMADLPFQSVLTLLEVPYILPEARHLLLQGGKPPLGRLPKLPQGLRQRAI